MVLYCFREESSELPEYSPSCIRVGGGGGGGGWGLGNSDWSTHFNRITQGGSTAGFFAVETLHN